jgi:hypothetical protein
MQDPKWLDLNTALTRALTDTAWRFEDGVSERVIDDVAAEMTDLMVRDWERSKFGQRDL